MVLLKPWSQSIPGWPSVFWTFDVVFFPPFALTLENFCHQFFTSPLNQGGSSQFHASETSWSHYTLLNQGYQGLQRWPENSLEALCLWMIAFLMSSDSSFVFTIGKKEQGIKGNFLNHKSHHCLVNSCHTGKANILDDSHLWFTKGESQCVSILIYRTGCQYQ